MEHAASVVFEFLNLAKDLPAGTFISVPARIVNEVINGLEQAKRNKKRAASLVNHTCDLMVPIVRAATSHTKEELQATLVEELDALTQLLREVQTRVLQITARGMFTRFLKRGSDQQLIDDLNAKLVQRLETFKVKGLLNMQIRQNVNEQARQQDQAETRQLIQKIDTRFDQIQITAAVTTRARPSRLRQAISPHFTGREDLVITAIAAVTGSARPHISFFGTGGIGKTSMAIAVAQHESCVQHFGDYRYFVECEALTSAAAVRSSILQALAGSSPAPTQGDPRQLLADMLSVDHMVLVIIDNFETPWNTPGQRTELTELLKEMAAMANVRLIATLRSDDAPASSDIAWTPLPVQVLQMSAARHLFLSINPGTYQAEHNALDQLLNEVDCLPLAVKLLAEVKKQQTCPELLRRWHHTKTSLVKTEHQGGTHLTSLDVSISLSLRSPRLDDAAGKLLATICQLPAGIIGGRAKLRSMDLGFRDVDETLDALLEVALVTDDRATGRITMPPPIRAYVSAQAFEACEEQLETYYITQIKQWDQLSMGDAGYVEKQDNLLAEVVNIRYFLEHRLRCQSSLRLGQAVFTFTYLEYLLRPSTHLIICLIDQLPSIGWEEQRPRCVERLAQVYYKLSKYTEAERELRTAQEQFVKIGDGLGAAQCLRRLGDVHRMVNKYPEAEHELRAAQAQFVEVEDKLAAAQCLKSLGNIHKMLGKHTEAEHELQAARAQFVEAGDGLGAAQCLRSLANIHRMLDQYAEAERELQAAQAQFADIGDRLGVARCLRSLAEVYRMLDRHTEAGHELQAAQAIFAEVGDRLGAARCLQTLGDIHRMLHKDTEAADALQAARAKFVEIGDRRGAAQCLRSMGDVHRMLGKYTEAEHALKAAQAQFVEIGDQRDAVQCLQSLADICRQQQRWQEGETFLDDAESLATSVGDQYGQAWVCRSRGCLYKAQERHGDALAQCTRSRDLFL